MIKRINWKGGTNCYLTLDYHFEPYDSYNKRECLNVGKVLTFRIHNVGTVPTFKTHNIGTPLFYDSFMDQTFWAYFIWV